MATELTGPPNLPALYLKAVLSARRHGDTLPATEYLRQDIDTDRDHLAEYARVCGFRLGDELPVTYPHVLGFGMAMRLMTDPDFPFPLVGLVHVANTIRQHRPLLVTEPLTQRVWAENLRGHRKGQQFDIVTETSVAERVVWREVSTYLRRGAGTPQEADGAEREEPDASEPATASWRVERGLGRRYAAVSGDRNPIHLHPLAAKAFGFPRTIAHGMWSKARCLSTFEGRLSEECTVDARFRKPLLLPSTVEFRARGNPPGWDFALHSRSGKPHLYGSVSAGVA